MKVRARRWLVLLIALAMVSASCGGSDDDDSDSDAQDDVSSVGISAPGDPVPEDADPNGLLRLVGLGFDTSGNIKWDATAITTGFNFPSNFHPLVFGALMRTEQNGIKAHPWLAESVDFPDDFTVKIKLRPNLKFTDGTPLTTANFKTSMDKMLARGEQIVTNSNDTKSITAVTVESPTEMTLKLKDPLARNLSNALAGGFGWAYHPSAGTPEFERNPIGAGPFLYKSFEPASKLVLTKSPSFFDQNLVKYKDLELLYITGTEATLNALRTHAIDAGSLTLDQESAAEASGLSVGEIKDGAPIMGQLCMSKPGLDDKRVRQALNYALDREALNELVLNGKGTAQTALQAESAPDHHEESQGHWTYDPDKAKALLKEYGKPVTIDAIVSGAANAAGSLPLRVTEVVQQQYKDVGITVNIVTSTDFIRDWFVGKDADAIAGIYFSSLPLEFGVQTLHAYHNGATRGTICHFEDQQLSTWTNEMLPMVANSEETKEAWAEVEPYMLDEAYWVSALFDVRPYAWDDNKIGRVNGYEPHVVTVATWSPLELYIKK
jgi:peptide/nickel transport system substrate-binding protein